MCLQQGHLEEETEGLLLATQSQSLRTGAIQAIIPKNVEDNKNHILLYNFSIQTGKKLEHNFIVLTLSLWTNRIHVSPLLTMHVVVTGGWIYTSYSMV